MPTQKLRDLRHEYKAAYTGYMGSVHALSDAGLRGELPTQELLEQEALAIRKLTRARRALLDALYEETTGQPIHRRASS